MTTRATILAREPSWIMAQDGEIELTEMYERHYSSSKSIAARRRRKPAKFCGPGKIIVLTTPTRDCLFVWRKFKDDRQEQGVCCAIFRNESKILSSNLVREADAIADFCWPTERHYTYVRPSAVASRNPGYCFIRAGWSRCGRTPDGLHVLERVIP